jgi:hypothetical protein
MHSGGGEREKMSALIIYIFRIRSCGVAPVLQPTRPALRALLSVFFDDPAAWVGAANCR